MKRPPFLALVLTVFVVTRSPAATAEEESLEFDGEMALEIAKSSDFNLHDKDFTIHARIRTRHGGTIFSKSRQKGRWGPNGKSFFIFDGRLVYDIGFVGDAVSAGEVGDGKWHDVVMTWAQSDGTVQFWIDGKLSGRGSEEDEEDEEDEERRGLRPTRAVKGHVVRIGYTRPDFPEEGLSRFEGRIAVVRFYQRQLEKAEIAALGKGDTHQDSTRAPKKGLVAKWKLRDKSDGKFRDLSGGGHEARLKRSARSLRPKPRRRVVKRPDPVKLPKDVYTLEEARPFLKEYCMGCHGRRRSRGELDIESALKLRPLVRNLDLWKNVLHRIQHGEMPPEDEEQPSRVERAILVRWLDREINEFDYSQLDDPGFEPARRLTHAEYSNTLRDLFGFELNLRELFPADLSGTSGFDNSANTLFIQPLLLERYMSAADLAIARALPDRAKIKTDAQKRARKAILFAEPNANTTEARAARLILKRFLPRAFRRPVESAELQENLNLFSKLRKKGDGFEAAVKKTLAATLVSPKFLMRIENAANGTEPYRVGHFEVANRLSYFLWASMPDAQLFELARQKKLQDPSVLRVQVARMLDDSRAETLGSLFAAQWLGFGILGTRVRLDPIDNPWCTDTLMAAMRRETEMLFAALVRQDAPIARLIDADYTYLNEELARHYRIPGVKGDQMRRVKLTDARRHGVFGHGSVLAITSFPGRTSPVVRGRWILADLLGTPPPPPPPNADEIADEIRENRRLTQREKLALHRENPKCASCHDEMDPLGLSLENFDWFGRWRDRSRGRPVDAGGRLPDGTEFTGPGGLRRVILAKRRGDLVRQVTRKMLSYALARQLEYYDEPAVRKIVAALDKDEQKFRTLIREIVLSYPFRYRKNPAPSGAKPGE